jgi:hypothetical protein
MREEIAVSVSEVFTEIAQQICHYHFVRNIGDIIFKHRYEKLRKAILDYESNCGNFGNVQKDRDVEFMA